MSGSVLQRLVPIIYLETPLGPAEAHWLAVPEADETPAHFGVFQCETKENWWWPNDQVRIRASASASRGDSRSPIHLSPERLSALRPHILRHKKSPFYEFVSKT